MIRCCVLLLSECLDTPPRKKKLQSWNPTAQCDGTFGRWLGHQGRALMNGDNVLRKEALDSSVAPSAMWGDNEKSATWNRALPQPCWHPDLGLPDSWSVGKKCRLPLSHLVCGILLWQSEWTKTCSEQRKPVGFMTELFSHNKTNRCLSFLVSKLGLICFTWWPGRTGETANKEPPYLKYKLSEM